MEQYILRNILLIFLRIVHPDNIMKMPQNLARIVQFGDAKLAQIVHFVRNAVVTILLYRMESYNIVYNFLIFKRCSCPSG